MADEEFGERLARQRVAQSWDSARRKAVLQEVLAVLTAKPTGLLSFDEVQKSLRLGHKYYKGVQDIPLEHIRGSVGRYRDFTQSFLPRREAMRERWLRVGTVALRRGLAPIEVYQVGEAYFVLDGNHRVSIARQSGAPTIEAHVWEFPTPVGLSAEADLDEVLIKAEYADFLQRTRLDRSRPEQNIVLTRPGGYRQLGEQIELYRHVLEKIDGVPISFEEAAAAWYDMIYTPAVLIIKQHGLLDKFPERTEADLFIWVWRHHQELRQQGINSLAHAARDFAQFTTIFRQIRQAVVGCLKKPWAGAGAERDGG